ncbi:hypothetical protein Pen01_54840 [Phytomonospora endophytica]|nr:hypothetical protein Pen01_54840 [Phytomonospora endophytica]
MPEFVEGGQIGSEMLDEGVEGTGRIGGRLIHGDALNVLLLNGVQAGPAGAWAGAPAGPWWSEVR